MGNALTQISHASEDGHHGGSDGDAPDHGASVPVHVLVVENNAIIALDTEEMLKELGVATVVCAATQRQALAAIETRVPDFALLDVRLDEGDGFDIAHQLASLGVPFAFVTGYGHDIAFPFALAKAPRLLKPVSIAALERVLARRR